LDKRSSINIHMPTKKELQKLADEKINAALAKGVKAETELRAEQNKTQARMAWVAILSSVVFTTIVLFFDIANAEILGPFLVAQAGVVGSYMGVTAWLSRSKNGKG